MKIKLLLTILAFGLTGTLLTNPVYGQQDPQFSQFYAAPLFLNPAFAGSEGNTRLGLNFRAQWPGLQGANFNTASLYFDHYLPQYKSGVGLILTGDQENPALQNISLGLIYAYQLEITNDLTFRPGISVGFFNRRLDPSNLTFGDQIDGQTFEISNPTQETFENTSVFKPDIGLGGVFYSRDYFLGYSAHHVARPDQAFLPSVINRLPIRHSVHAGYRFPFNTGFRQSLYTDDGLERSITPVAQYKWQSQFRQLDLGTYLTYEPLVVGLYYRGIPVGSNGGNESAIMLVGLIQGDLKIGYSFDYTLSGLGIDTGGSHEVSVVYRFSLNPNQPPYNVRKIPCPEF